jgi:Ca2+/Na+ antiporter
MKNAIINLLKVKSIISLAVIFTSCYLTIIGKLEVASFMALTGAIVTYYFKKDDKEEKEVVEIPEEKEDTQQIGRYG